MIKVVKAGERSGLVTVPASKSWAHRLLIAASLSRDPSVIICDGSSADIDATADCLRAMGAGIDVCKERISVVPINRNHINNDCGEVRLCCRESGSTLRFLVPVVGALGLNAVFVMEGRLPQRPMDAYFDCLSEHGMKFNKEDNLLHISGQLNPGKYSIPGNISSQYISGLLLALPLLNKESTLEITGSVESADYIRMTESALKAAGYEAVLRNNTYTIGSANLYNMPGECRVESDWSSASFFLSMGALSQGGINVCGMNPDSAQGDRRILDILKEFGADISVSKDCIKVKYGHLKGIRLDASQIPDLVPVIASVASLAEGETVIYNAERLKLKESDRLATTESMLRALGGDVTKTDDGLIIRGQRELEGGECESYNDHRIAMAAAVAALRCKKDVTVKGAECTAKSFGSFWDKADSLQF